MKKECESKFTSCELLKIYEILQKFNINFPSTDQIWKTKTRRDITKDVLKLIKLNLITMKESVEYSNNQYNAYCSKFITHIIDDYTSLNSNCVFGERCNVCGFRVHVNIKGFEDDPSLYDSACICALLFKYDNTKTEEEIADMLQSWFDVTNMYYKG